jgi:hypothetical protein
MASPKPSVKHSYYTKDLITSSWYQTKLPQRLTTKAPISNHPILPVKSVSTFPTNIYSASSTTKSDYAVSDGRLDADMFFSPSSLRGNGAARASPPVLGRPHECSQLGGGSGTSAGGTTNIHHYMDNETPICQVCTSLSYSKK